MRTPSSLVLALTLVAPSLLAQAEFRWEQSDALGVRFQVHKKLFPVPLKLGESDPNEKAQFEPKDEGDYIHGRLGKYSWGLHVMDFPRKKEAPKTEGSNVPASAKEAIERMRPAVANFREWVTEHDPRIQDRKFVKKAFPGKAKGKGLDYLWWEYTDTTKVSTGVKGKEEQLIWYHCAASYELPDREVALTMVVPVKRGTEADPAHMKWMEAMCQSLQLLEGGGDTAASESKRDEFANTPARKAELEKAKANIANLKGWDYFTTPNYIVLYAWDPEATTPEKQKESVKFARELVGKLEEVRELYIKEFPPHDKMEELYSVLRICGNPQEFHRYSGPGTPGNVVGWFSPDSKELVVFNDTQRLLQSGKDIVMTTQHEGWHQYAQTYFGGKGELHRWFDEGHGDYFGGWAKKGKSWAYAIDKGRHTSIRSQISRKNFVPLREIVTWNKDKFYTERGPDYYAEGYSLIDFLRRGPDVLGKKFDERWAKVIPLYTSTFLETKDQKKAVETAFAGIDWEEFEAAWVEWVRTTMK